MEPPEIPVYSLSEILGMDNSHIRIFLSTLRIRPSDDSRGKIALKLNRLGKLTYPSPINSLNLSGLIKITKPSQLAETQNMVRAAGITPSDDRMTLMIQYLSYAQVPLAESPRFLLSKAETPVVGGLQFEELPPEMKLKILGRVSPTAREAATVSRGMRELSDTVLLDNIRTGNLVDPTLGIPDRAEYFKLKPDGSGDYFASLPGLWESLKYARQYRRKLAQYLLIYGELDLDTIQNKLTVTKTKSLSDLSEATNFLSNVKTEYGTNIIKFAGIASIDSYEFVTTGLFARDTGSSVLDIYLNDLLRYKLHVSSLDLKIPVRAQFIELIKQISENTNIEQTYKPDEASIRIGGGSGIHFSNPEISLRMVALNADDLLNGTLILPSLRDDVYDVN